MKKMIALVCSVILSGTMLTACTTADNDSNTTTTPETTVTTVT